MAQEEGKTTVAVTATGVDTSRKVTVIASGTNPDEVFKAAQAAANATGTKLPRGK